MRYWALVFLLSLLSFAFSGFLYFKTRGKPASITDDIELLFTGDIMLSRSVGEEMRERGDYAYPFRLIADELRGADLTFGNLEGPISNRGENQGSIYSFRADPRVLEGLTLAGFDVLSLANNHIWDWGGEALRDTVRILREEGISSVGAGENFEEANRPVVFDFHGTRVGFLAYTNLYPPELVAGGSSPGVSDFSLSSTIERIAELSEDADIVVVSFHWGEEYKTKSNDLQKKLAHAMIRAGADFVIGHHPHVAEEIEKYRGGWIPLEAGRPETGEPSMRGRGRPLTGWIAYSLGNFVFDQDFSEETMRGLMLRVFVRDGKTSRVEEVPIRISKTFQPYVVQ